MKNLAMFRSSVVRGSSPAATARLILACTAVRDAAAELHAMEARNVAVSGPP